jgi:hypothetical protein
VFPKAPLRRTCQSLIHIVSESVRDLPRLIDQVSAGVADTASKPEVAPVIATVSVAAISLQVPTLWGCVGFGDDFSLRTGSCIAAGAGMDAGRHCCGECQNGDGDSTESHVGLLVEVLSGEE